MPRDIKDFVVSNLVTGIHNTDCFSGGFFIFNPSTTVCLLVLADAGHTEGDDISILCFVYIMACFLRNE